jgi:hypothetical protein
MGNSNSGLHALQVTVFFITCMLSCLNLAFVIDRHSVSVLHWYLNLFLFCCNCVFVRGVIILSGNYHIIASWRLA